MRGKISEDISAQSTQWIHAYSEGVSLPKMLKNCEIQIFFVIFRGVFVDTGSYGGGGRESFKTCTQNPCILPDRVLPKLITE